MATTLEKSLNLIILGSNAWRVEVEFIWHYSVAFFFFLIDYAPLIDALF